jgi:hypothetical protein
MNINPKVLAAALGQVKRASDLRARLEAARPGIAQVAQSIYDEWQQDEDGWDEVFGGGGICDEIAKEVSSFLSDIDTTEGGADGDDHAFLIAYDDTEAYEVDIPPGVYEFGGGYVWTKRPNVTITPDDVYIGKVDRSLLDDLLEYDN